MDKNSVKKTFTKKSGYFVFSRKFSSEELTPLLIEASVLYKTVSDLPILPSISSQLHAELVRRSIFGTAALEGNPLSEERVGEIIAASGSVRAPERAEKEIQNLKRAYDGIDAMPTKDSPIEITQSLIKKIHAVVTDGIEQEYNLPGKYRNHKVQVGDSEHGGQYTPPKCLPDIEDLMMHFEEWINSEEIMALDAFLRAPLAHYYFGLIHPFGDGNGRTARLIEALTLHVSGIKYVPVMLSNFYYRNIDAYFLAFSQARKNKENDVTPFLKFALQGTVESLNEIKDRITFFIRKFSLRDYYEYLKAEKRITRRQHDLLTTLLSSDLTPFNLKSLFTHPLFTVLYRDVSQRTARRDLKKLKALGLLNQAGGKEYILNIRALG